MTLHESGEDYLEAISGAAPAEGPCALHRCGPAPGLLQALGEPGGFNPEEQRVSDHGEKDGRLELTPMGEANAQRVYERHRFLSDWLVKLGVSPEVAATDACRIEHDLSAETFQCLKAHVQKYTQETST